MFSAIKRILTNQPPVCFTMPDKDMEVLEAFDISNLNLAQMDVLRHALTGIDIAADMLDPRDRDYWYLVYQSTKDVPEKLFSITKGEDMAASFKTLDLCGQFSKAFTAFAKVQPGQRASYMDKINDQHEKAFKAATLKQI